MQVSKIVTALIFLFHCITTQGQDTGAVKVITREFPEWVTVTGKVTDASTGTNLRGIRVTYKNSSAAITDSSGFFSLKVPSLDVTVSLEGEGFQSKQNALKGNNNITAKLYEDTYTSMYDEAHLPLKIAPKNQVPFAVSSVQTEGNWGRFTETPSTFLQGRVAGLNVVRRSGTPTGGASLLLRGINSINTTNQPLIIVDGVIFDNRNYGTIISGDYFDPLSTIDSRDIDNITVIKDGSSTYGTKGANGVIIISTARARQLGTKIDFGVFAGVNFKPEQYPVMNAAQHRTYLSAILKSSGLTDTQIQALPYMNDNTTNNDYYRYHNTTNWQDEVLGNSITSNIYLKITGGDNIAKYGLSLGYMNAGSVIKNTDFKRYSMRFNGDLNLSKKLTATTDLSFSFYNQNLRNQGTANKTNPLFLALVKAPLLRSREVSDSGIESPTFADRDTFNISNPSVIIENSKGTGKGYRFFGAIGFNYQLLRSVLFSSTIGITFDEARQTFFLPRKGVTTDTLTADIASSRSGSGTKTYFALYNDSRLTYNKRFSNIHDLALRLGVRYQHAKSEDDFGLAFNSPIDQLTSVQFGTNALRQIGGSIGEASWLNTYFNTDYSYLDKYFLSLDIAMDGSSRFGKNIQDALTIGDNKLAVSPSLAAAWLISSERFMHGKTIDVLKLRASFGLSGNDDIGNYPARQTYITQNFLGLQGLVRSSFGNDQLQWEKMRKLNIGLDAAFLNERVNITVDAYQHKTDKMLVFETAPVASGSGFFLSNSGAMSTTGVEVTVNARISNRSFKWDIGFNIARSNSKIDKLPVDPTLTNFAGATYITQLSSAPNLFYGYKTNGVFASDAVAAQENLSLQNNTGAMVAFKGGDVRFVDVNNDRIIDEKDRQVIGDPNPEFFGGITNKFAYKRFSLDALFTFMQGNDIYNYTRNQLEAQSGFSNQTVAVLNAWKNNGDITNVPKTTFGDPMGNSRFSDRWIEDGSYLRLRTVTLSYNLPFKQGSFKYAVVYVTGNNVFTLTKYKGFDPEFSAGESIFAHGVDNTLEPQFKSVQFGLRIGL